MTEIIWERYPLISTNPIARSWLLIQLNEGRAQNTIEAYGRSLEDYLTFCHHRDIHTNTATRAEIALYVRDLAERPSPQGANVRRLDSGSGLSNATMQQRITAVRLYYDYVIETGARTDNPVGRGRYTPGRGFGGQRDRALIPRYQKLPWIPSDEQWLDILDAARLESLRNRVMLAFAYDAALRREELCSLRTDDINPGQRLIRIRAETTKNHRERMVPFSAPVSQLYGDYLRYRRTINRSRGPLFLSESRRNHAEPISIWTWSKVIRRISEHSHVSQFTTHTLRHLRLTDLARAGWDVHELAYFAGHRSIQTTLLYIHVSGRDLVDKLERGMASIHTWRVSTLQEVLHEGSLLK
jgi:integrase/recombinase XerD